MSGLFGGGKKPKVEAPQRMPDPEDPALVEARRRKALDITARGGRAATILTPTPGMLPRRRPIAMGGKG